MNRTQVSAVVPTRGDVDLTRIVESLQGFGEIIIWNNAVERNLAVYARYAAIERATRAVIYTQDDDCLIDADAIVAAYEPDRLVANMPRSRWDDYPDSTLVGWGAVFDSDLANAAFDRFEMAYPAEGCSADPTWLRTCDVVFSALTPRTVIDVGFGHLPWAEDPARAMFKQRGHKEERDRMLDLCRQIRNWDDDDRRDDA